MNNINKFASWLRHLFYNLLKFMSSTGKPIKSDTRLYRLFATTYTLCCVINFALRFSFNEPLQQFNLRLGNNGSLVEVCSGQFETYLPYIHTHVYTHPLPSEFIRNLSVHRYFYQIKIQINSPSFSSRSIIIFRQELN